MQIATDIRVKSCFTILKAVRREQAMKHGKCLMFLQMMLFAAYTCKCETVRIILRWEIPRFDASGMNADSVFMLVQNFDIC